MQLGDRVLNLRLRRLSGEDGDLELTTHEARVLEYLVQHPGQDISGGTQEHVWSYSRNMTTNNQILAAEEDRAGPLSPRFILTVHGTSYRFEHEDGRGADQPRD